MAESEEWVLVTDALDDDAEYYWNTVTDERTLSLPDDLEVEWEAARAPTMLDYWYYWNPHTRVSSWDPPTGARDEAAASSPTHCAEPPSGPTINGGDPAVRWQLTVAYRGMLVPSRDGPHARQRSRDFLPRNEESWEAPLETRWIFPGVAASVARGCPAPYERFSGQAGLVTDVSPMPTHRDPHGQPHISHVELQLPEELGATRIWLPARLLEPLPQGTIVQLLRSPVSVKYSDSMSAAPLLSVITTNEIATVCSIDGYEDDDFEGCREIAPNLYVRDRWVNHGHGNRREIVQFVRESDGCIRAVLGASLLPRCPLWLLDFNASVGYPAWKKDNMCTFVASDGQLHKFSINFPANFKNWNQLQLEDRTPWPMMVFMHGAGGGSFCSASKKAIKSTGVNCVVGKCVVVSPICEWTWKDTPKPWVGELISTLMAADYIDHRSVYLTGCSMGGMGVWEVASALPHLFAAIAPVAAHHHTPNTDFIVKQLRDIPICICHSLADGTCPMRAELPLWRKLREVNQRMQVNLVRSVDHCCMFERTFCDDTCLYDWLLMHRREDAQ